jgi:hypothetical protein
VQDAQQSEAGSTASQWQQISANERRVAGVLVEKAKTTPSGYPMTLNSVRVACNQKSNRYPQMQLDEEDVMLALDSLRSHSAVIEVQGDGRTAKYRHLLYDWLGVNKTEIAVMTELLLRGAQTIGELRGRAARMEPIADLAALRPVLDALEQKKLIVYLTPQGRGCVVTHALYHPQELEKVRREHGAPTSLPPQDKAVAMRAPSQPTSAPTLTQSPLPNESETMDAMQREIGQLRAENSELREQLERMIEELRREINDIREQLGI